MERQKAVVHKQSTVTEAAPHIITRENPTAAKKTAERDTEPKTALETPFEPRFEEHAAALSGMPSAQQRDFILQLQRTYGNRYVQRLTKSVRVQAKLKVSQPGDPAEQEADRVAKEVTRSMAEVVQRQMPEEEEVQGKAAIQRQMPDEEEEEVQGKAAIQRQMPDEEEEEVQGKAARIMQSLNLSEEVNSPGIIPDNSLETCLNNARGGGQSLSENVRQPMEQAMGTDFSSVQIHNDAEADILNQQLASRAFTTGRDIFFRAGEYTPGSDGGNELIAHELTHVVQQIGRQELGGYTVTPTKSANCVKPASISQTTPDLQRQSVPGCAGYGNFSDLGNGLFGTSQPTTAGEVTELVNEIREKSIQAGLHQNIKVITGTHGDSSGHLVGEEMFYTEDLVHEGHKVAEAGWINVLDVKGKSKSTIENWMAPGSSAIILAWCYSQTSVENWDSVHCYKNEADYQAGKAVW